MSLVKKFFKFVIPSIISMWIFSLYTMVDGIFVARGVGPQALAAVNLAMPFTAGVFALGLLFATGTSTVVSIALGQGDEEAANRYFNQNLVILALLSLSITLVTWLNLDRIARFLGATESILAYTKEYVGVIGGFAVFFIVSYNLEVLVKADGAPHISTIGVTTCALMNVVLDYLFVIRFGWGVRGAAVATGLAQVTSTLILTCYFLFRRNKLRFGRFRFDLSVYRRIIPVGLSDGVTELSNGVVIFLFNRTILSIVGETGIVSYTVISYVNTLVLMTMSGTAQGIQPLTSFYCGREDRKSCHTLLRYGMTAIFVFSLSAFLFVRWKGDWIVGLFINETERELFLYSLSALGMYATSFLLLGCNVLLAGFFAAIERPAYSLSISLGRGLVVLSLTLLVLSRIFGDIGIWYSPFVSEAICLLLSGGFLARYFASNRKEKPVGSGKAASVQTLHEEVEV